MRPVVDCGLRQGFYTLQRGFVTGVQNLRGVVTKGLYEGGQKERELANKYMAFANACAAWPRTAEILRIVAETYQREAESEDESAKLQR